jgi:D-amino peptidase
MDVYVVADMEGVSGIVNPQQAMRGEPEFQEGRRLLAGDVNAAVAGAFDGGATRVVVGDIHASQRNLPMELLDPRAEYEVPPTPDLSTLHDGFASLVIIGMHAMSGTSRAFLEHTIEPAWHRYSIDGIEYGEIALLAFGAAADGVPTVFVSGDRAAIDEASALVPAVEGVIVKEGLGRDWCRTLAPAIAHERIRGGVTRALGRRHEIRPPMLTFPVTVRIEFNRCSGADVYEGRPGIRRIDGFTVEWTAQGIIDLIRL